MKLSFINILIIVCIVIICSVQADIRSVPPGGTVFIGEEQLDISAAGISPGSQIAWWAPGSSLEEIPADMITVTNPASFSALSSSFSGKEGIWYSLADKAPVIKIKQPKMNIRISDTTSDFDATGKWFPRGHLASFQVETNLNELRSRPGVNGAPVDIIIISPGGAQYSAVTGPVGSFSLINIPISSALYDTGAVWNTGGTEPGIYSIHAECTANRINSNNEGYGLAVSRPVTILIQDENPLITEAEIREKARTSEPLSPVITLTAHTTILPATTIYQTPVNPTPSVLITSQGITGTISPPVPTLSSIPELSSSIPPTPSSPLSSDIPSTPFPGILAVIALIYAVFKQ